MLADVKYYMDQTIIICMYFDNTFENIYISIPSIEWVPATSDHYSQDPLWKPRSLYFNKYALWPRVFPVSCHSGHLLWSLFNQSNTLWQNICPMRWHITEGFRRKSVILRGNQSIILKWKPCLLCLFTANNKAVI